MELRLTREEEVLEDQEEWMREKKNRGMKQVHAP
jgi:hypothetical protein